MTATVFERWDDVETSNVVGSKDAGLGWHLGKEFLPGT